MKNPHAETRLAKFVTKRIDESKERWSCFFDQIAAKLRWNRVSYQAAILMGSVWLAWTSSGVKMPWVEWGRSALQ